MNRKGMTLLELIIYISLAMFLLAPVIMLVNRSSFFMARDTTVSSLRVTGNEIKQVLYDDIKNTGYKTEIHFSDSDSMELVLNTNVQICSLDLSSFTFARGYPFDSLSVVMGRIDEGGTWLGIDTISYYVENYKLIREVRGTASGNSRHSIASNVESLRFHFSTDMSDWDVDGTDVTQKELVKYIKVIILLNSEKGLASSVKKTTYDMGDFSISFYDNIIREHYEITIPVINNGLIFEL
ncbi:hypothetical protein QA601_03795 [Chitinispirillales bacterium ANBcel5]|uniref:hypothetical protein n=1 Tax=Cellulosispirillum alkaliphilum TaxID=3039283 RepID=UPI002A571B21|nr:hypothetical protein [Chitinispirillales bacterium ANBcel5]